jgi:hypothetical protein
LLFSEVTTRQLFHRLEPSASSSKGMPLVAIYAVRIK